MPVNLPQVFDRIKQIGLGAKAYQENLEALHARTRSCFKAWAGRLPELREKVERACQSDSSLRCALPLDEPLDVSFPEPDLGTGFASPPLTILAADGSQILPERHAALLYSLINVGAIALQSGSGHSPEVFTDSSLLFAEELYSETSMLSGEAIEQRRDIAERKKLLELAPRYPTPLLALTDGPVELWGSRNSGENEYHQNLETHKSILSQLQEKDVTVAGYVDKPGADLVVRTLEIAGFTTDDEFKNIRKLHPLRSVTDRWLYYYLPAGHRSAVFELQSSSRLHYTGILALHFFYLNVGESSHPSLVRVEFPGWVAQDSSKLDLLHTALLQQCQVMGVRPYPYILHRAHEIAVVKLEEKKQVEALLDMEIRRAGGEVENPSNKQSSKDLPGRRRK
jgi:hypothetical protein